MAKSQREKFLRVCALSGSFLELLQYIRADSKLSDLLDGIWRYLVLSVPACQQCELFRQTTDCVLEPNSLVKRRSSV